MNFKILTALALLAATPALAAGSICIVCPPGYDCSGDRPVAKTGDARLATIGDIPTTAAQVGAVPATRTIAGLALSEDITMEQLRDALDACNIPIADTSGGGTIESRCSTTDGTHNVAGNPSATFGANCWCRYRTYSFRKVFSGDICGADEPVYSAWMFNFRYPGSDGGSYCESYCAKSCSGTCTSTCSNDMSWRIGIVW